jgi:hypothetical protein
MASNKMAIREKHVAYFQATSKHSPLVAKFRKALDRTAGNKVEIRTGYV